MARKSGNQKSCGPQPFAEKLPAGDWPLDQLGDYAQGQYRTIIAGEQTLAPAYWRLGHALTFARKQLGRSHWGRFLKSLDIDKSRSSKACAIFRHFSSPAHLKELTVEQAYEARRDGRPKQEPLIGEASATTAVNFAKSLTKIDQAASETIRLSAELTREERRELLKNVMHAITRLIELERELKKTIDEDVAGRAA